MIPRRIFAVLTTMLFVLSVASAVFFAFRALLVSLEDTAGARVVQWIGFACLLLLAIDLVLLVGALGLAAMRSADEAQRDR